MIAAIDLVVPLTMDLLEELGLRETLEYEANQQECGKAICVLEELKENNRLTWVES